jgi:hypothetical protein
VPTASDLELAGTELDARLAGIGGEAGVGQGEDA